jgi:hypothetical protein
MPCRVQELAGGCRTWAVLGLATLDSPTGESALLELAETAPLTAVAVAAVRAFGRGSGSAVGPGLERLLRHDDADVRTEVLVALAHRGISADQTALVTVATGLPDAQFRTAAIVLAGKVDNAGAAALRERAERMQDPALRASALRALEPKK